MDVLLIDDKVAEGEYLRSQWQHHDFAVWQAFDVQTVKTLARTKELPAGWAERPEKFDAFIIDLDLGQDASGSAGGLIAAGEIAGWLERLNESETPENAFTVVLRTEDVDDERSLAAVLMAELMGRPLPLWGKEESDLALLLEYLENPQRDRLPTCPEGAILIHQVDVLTESGSISLGKLLFKERVALVWERLNRGIDFRLAVVSTGFLDHNDFWEDFNTLFSAITYFRDEGRHFHMHEANTLDLGDFERTVLMRRREQLKLLLEENQTRLAGDQRRLASTQANLKRELAGLEAWLKNGEGQRPRLNHNVNQGEVTGLFGSVLGDKDVQDLFWEP